MGARPGGGSAVAACLLLCVRQYGSYCCRLCDGHARRRRWPAIRFYYSQQRPSESNGTGRQPGRQPHSGLHEAPLRPDLLVWVGTKPETRSPNPKNPSPNPKYPNPKNPKTNSGSNPRYPKLLRVIRVLGHGTRNTRITRNSTQPK